MKIISHRGYWKNAPEKNTETAFSRSFQLGFGTETDIRDYRQNLVISHDIPTGNEISFSDFLQMAAASAIDHPLTLALNIKADGLAGSIANHLKQHPELDCFVFDMSVPDMRSYLETDIPVFTRISEVEQQPVWLERAAGIWLDAFQSEWYDISFVKELLEPGKRVCIVSAELHGRPHKPLWERLLPLSNEQGLILCTDLPSDAFEFFRSETKIS